MLARSVLCDLPVLPSLHPFSLALSSFLSPPMLAYKKAVRGRGEREASRSPAVCSHLETGEVSCGPVKPQLRRANILLLPWRKSSGHQRRDALHFLGEDSALSTPAPPLPGLCVRKEFIIAQVWEEAQGTLLLRNICKEVKRMLLGTRVSEGFVVLLLSLRASYED